MAAAPPRFLVDEMLQRLGRWLRAAGYDTRIALDAEPDYYLLRRAIEEDRLLLTCDRQLSQYRNAEQRVILLHGSLQDCVRQLTAQLALDWQYRPFSRCLVCNSPLQNASNEQLAAAPDDIQASRDQALYCPHCQQVFWPGSHVKRMRRQLDSWQHTLHAP